MQTLSAFIVLIFYCSISGCQTLTKGINTNLQVIKSNTPFIKYRINGSSRNWAVSPKINPDILKFECIKNINRVEFISDVDSISFIIKPKDTIRFAIAINKDTAITEIIGISKNVNFDNQYINKFNDKITIDVPEVSELTNILLALSVKGRQDSNMINMTTPYYHNVIQHFSSFKNEPIMNWINTQMQLKDETEKYNFYYDMKMDACGYYFTPAGAINQDSSILHMGFNENLNVISDNKKKLEDFAKKTNFRKFYTDNKFLYDSLKLQYKKTLPIKKMKQWLEHHFPTKYNYYKVTFSPLVYGAHSTMSYTDNNFSVVAAFVAPIFYNSKYSQQVNGMISARVLFTELDHNYVNPVTDNYRDAVNEIFKKREKWARGSRSQYYPDAYLVFNEYMTWAVFTLYCYDNYSNVDFEAYMEKTEKFMDIKRGFINYQKFDRALLDIYKKNKGKKTVSELFPLILKWCSTQ